MRTLVACLVLTALTGCEEPVSASRPIHTELAKCKLKAMELYRSSRDELEDAHRLDAPRAAR